MDSFHRLFCFDEEYNNDLFDVGFRKQGKEWTE